MKHLYVFTTSSEPRYFKFGFSKNPLQRLANIRTASPVPVNLMYCGPVEFAENAEKIIHKLLKTHRNRGEWFTDIPEDTWNSVKRLLWSMEKSCSCRSCVAFHKGRQ